MTVVLFGLSFVGIFLFWFAEKFRPHRRPTLPRWALLRINVAGFDVGRDRPPSRCPSPVEQRNISSGPVMFALPLLRVLW